MKIIDAAATRAALPFDRLIPALRAMFESGCEVPQRHTHAIADAVIHHAQLFTCAHRRLAAADNQDAAREHATIGPRAGHCDGAGAPGCTTIALTTQVCYSNKDQCAGRARIRL